MREIKKSRLRGCDIFIFCVRKSLIFVDSIYDALFI